MFAKVTPHTFPVRQYVRRQQRTWMKPSLDRQRNFGSDEQNKGWNEPKAAGDGGWKAVKRSHGVIEQTATKKCMSTRGGPHRSKVKEETQPWQQVETKTTHPPTTQWPKFRETTTEIEPERRPDPSYNKFSSINNFVGLAYYKSLCALGLRT